MFIATFTGFSYIVVLIIICSVPYAYFIPYAYGTYHMRMVCTIRIWYNFVYHTRTIHTIRVWYVPYVYGMYYMRMVQFCIPYTYSITIRVWYVPYVYNDVLRAVSISRLLECI